MKKREPLLGLFCLWANFLSWGYQWPVEPKVLSSFAQNSGQGFERGIRILAPSAEVLPIDGGELVFAYQEGESIDHSLPYPLGSFRVIQHGNLLLSMYAHLENEPSSNTLQDVKFFDRNRPIGKSGMTGFAPTPGVSLYVYDIGAEQFVNPLLLLPPLKDTSRPVIRNVKLENKGGSIQLPTAESVAKGEWQVTAEIFDQSQAVPTFWPMGVYKVSLFLNGQELFSVTMDTLKKKEGSTRVQPSKGLTHKELYADHLRMKLGTVSLNPGFAQIEIVARDFSGNERNQLFRFKVE